MSQSTKPTATDTSWSGPPRIRWVPSSLAALAGVMVAGMLAISISRWWTDTSYRPALFGLPDTGQLTSIGLPLAQFVHELAGIAVVGALFLNCLLGSPRSRPAGDHLLAMATRWAWVWAASTSLWIVFTVSDLTGAEVLTLPAHGESVMIVFGSSRVLAEVLTFWVALAVALFGARLAPRRWSVISLLPVTLAMLPSALTGHASHHASPVVASLALGVHVAASAIWVGGLLVLTVHLRLFPEDIRRSVTRFSRAALLCVTAIGFSGVLEAAVTLDSWTGLWHSHRGHLIVAKAAVLAGLVLIGYVHRRNTMAPAYIGRLIPLLRLATVELALMGATIGIAVVLSTTP
ncbi:putative copper export protein [Nakamurella sp. UYEF19]|uniref:copper resistance D family protein n=1 Tax=Nakamurella sp. UYEF19 TaxID=1756392 RepID=UPI003399328E